jgi:hypothetical protein
VVFVGSATVLQDVGGQQKSVAVAVNNSGDRVGYSETGKGDQDAVLWSPTGTPMVLQSRGGRGSCGAAAINQVGRSIGYCLTATGQDAVLWSTTGIATVLQDVGGEGFSDVVAINASGHSVGYSLTASGDEAMLWSPSGKATNLGAILGSAWSDTQAVGINQVGDILGYGFFEGGQRGFLLTPAFTTAVSAALFSNAPVPEPSTWAMFMVGFTGLALVGRRRFRKLGTAP